MAAKKTEERTKATPTAPLFKLWDLVKIRHSEWIGPIVELRGALGPGGAQIYRVRYRGKPRPAYVEVREDQLIPIPPGDLTSDQRRSASRVRKPLTVTISISRRTQKKFQILAARSGKDVPAFIQELVEKQVREVRNGAAAAPAHGGMRLNAILAPLREAFAESGLSDEELKQLVSASIQEVRAARKGRQ
jgi:hypothetical protein